MRGGVFICYRREDSAGFAGRIYDRLKNSLGRESVFIDVDNIPAGRDFVEVLTERVGRCDALVALIGRSWLTSTDKDNHRRLDDPNDFVRIEIAAALERDVPVIPVLVDGAAMPQANDLPDSLKKLARRQGIEVSHNRFDSDAERLSEALAGIDGGNRGPTPGAGVAPLSVPSDNAAASGARWLFGAFVAVIAVVGGTGFLLEQRGVPQEQSRHEPTSDFLGMLPPPQTTSALNTAAPSLPGNVPNAAAPAPPLETPSNSVAPAPRDDGSKIAALAPNAERSELPAEKIADHPPPKIGKAVTPDTPTTPPQWMNVEDFLAYYRGQISWIYPDRAWGRCQDGVSQRAAHWSPHPAGQHFLLRGTNERTFRTSAAEMTSMGFKIQYDNVFPECDGSTHHQTLWMKAD